jgi:hypothetical protein
MRGAKQSKQRRVRVVDLKTLSDAAEGGPWAYRPNEFDDWGLIRGGQRPDDTIGQC